MVRNVYHTCCKPGIKSSRCQQRRPQEKSSTGFELENNSSSKRDSYRLFRALPHPRHPGQRLLLRRAVVRAGPALSPAASGGQGRGGSGGCLLLLFPGFVSGRGKCRVLKLPKPAAWTFSQGHGRHQRQPCRDAPRARPGDPARLSASGWLPSLCPGG